MKYKHKVLVLPKKSSKLPKYGDLTILANTKNLVPKRKLICRSLDSDKVIGWVDNFYLEGEDLYGELTLPKPYINYYVGAATQVLFEDDNPRVCNVLKIEEFNIFKETAYQNCTKLCKESLLPNEN